MIEYGFESPLFMAKAVIAQADPRYLKVAVSELMSAMWYSEGNCIDKDEVFDRLVQVTATGSYRPSEVATEEVRQAVAMADEMLSNIDSDAMESFKEELDQLPGTEDDWLDRFKKNPENEDEEEEEETDHDR